MKKLEKQVEIANVPGHDCETMLAGLQEERRAHERAHAIIM